MYAACCSLFGQDVLEFVIRPDQPSGQLVTYRSMAGEWGRSGGPWLRNTGGVLQHGTC